jgi:hypothetical protein
MADITLSTNAFNNLEAVFRSDPMCADASPAVWMCSVIEPLLPIALCCNRANAIEQEKHAALTLAVHELKLLKGTWRGVNG